jgi:hypothetical protein
MVVGRSAIFGYLVLIGQDVECKVASERRIIFFLSVIFEELIFFPMLIAASKDLRGYYFGFQCNEFRSII